MVPKERTTRAHPTRRTVLKGGLAAAGVAAARPTFALAPAPPTYHTWLLERVTFGRNPEMESQLETLGWQGFLDWQLDWTNIDDSAAEAEVASLVPTVGMTPWDIQLTWYMVPQTPTGYASSLPALRAWRSRRQLLHVMADFWTNVFNRYLGQDGQYTGYTQYDERAFYDPAGANALGNFRQMLRATAEGGSMNWYLNQWASNFLAPIENYPRELLELHTLGTDPLLDSPTTPAYDENDVIDASKVFTGWSIDFDQYPQEFGEFLFEPLKHSPGPKTVYGVTYPEGGVTEGQDLLDDLATYERTAKHMALRMIRWFITENPPSWLVDKVQAAFLSHGDNIRAAVQALFEESTYAALDPAERTYRRPLNLAVSALRVLDPTIVPIPVYPSGPYWTEYDGLLTGLERMGQRPGFWPAPDGYPYEDSAWLPGLQPRLSFLDDLCHNRVDGLDLPTSRLNDLFGATAPTLYAQKASAILTGGTVPNQHVRRIQNALDAIDALPGYTDDLRRDALALIASAPTHQYLH